MQPLKSFEEVDRLVAKRLGDPHGSRFDSEFRRDGINLAQYEYVERSGVLKKRAPITNKENISIYELPDDCIRPLRLENSKGEKISASDSAFLQQRFGQQFRAKTSASQGAPKYYYSDLTGRGRFELYPRPTTDFSKDALEFTFGTFVQREYAGEPPLAYDVAETKLYVLTTNHLLTYKILEDRLVLERDVNHALGVAYSGSIEGRLRVLKFKFDSDLTLFDIDSAGTAFFINGNDIVRVLPTGVVSTFGTASTGIQHLIEFEFHDPFTLYYQLDNLQIKRCASLIGFGEIAVSSESRRILQSTGNFNDRNIYLAIGDSGLKKITTATHVVSTVSNDNITGCGALPDEDGSVFVLNQTDSTIEKVKPVDDSVTLTGLTINQGNDINPIISNHQDRFWYIERDTENFIDVIDYAQEVVNLVKTRRCYNDFNKRSVTPSSSEFVAVNDQIFHRTLFNCITISSFEHGAIVRLNDVTLNQDEGIILDIEDSVDEINFTSESGAIESFISDESVATVYYVRCPKQDQIEIIDYDSIIEYLKYLAKKDATDAKSISESRRHYALFLNKADREAGSDAFGDVPNESSIPSVNY